MQFDFSELQQQQESNLEKIRSQIALILSDDPLGMELDLTEAQLWDYPDPAKKSTFREDIATQAKTKLSQNNRVSQILTDPWGRILAVYQLRKDLFSVHELPLIYRIHVGYEGMSPPPLPTPKPYERTSGKARHSYVIRSDGSRVELKDSELLQSSLFNSVYNYLLTDEVCIYWDGSSSDAVNFEAMCLIRDADCLHYELDLELAEFPVEVKGDALVCETDARASS